MTAKNTIFFIEGNISAGKSTLLATVRDIPGISVATFEEDVANFSQELKQFYENPSSKTCMNLQQCILRICRQVLASARTLMQTENTVILAERSAMSSAAIFAAAYVES